ncbi:uncharacterized protein LOC123259432 [Cotesia glomerata]|uniref:H15 domain-containing protein n=1 Tax=Cotesia glomerata TaxID=32391 RepID=A0AAV7J3R6_COTGL|nr:uncharacterized protein LOC123259432 [Cotesia glomerata]KAH0566606.1 hypothetical protein KQX54_002382 [Cotesia glomerata]
MRVNRGKKITRPARNVNLVLHAMKNLGEENGSTVNNIIEYISDTVEHPASKREVVAALKRVVEFGIMDRKRGRYFLPGEKRRINLSGGNRQDSSSGKSESNVSTVDARATGRSRVSERGHRFKSRNTDKTKREGGGKSKDSSRRKRKPKRKPKQKSKSVKRTRFARSLKSYDLSDYYKNPSYRASGVSSIDSMEYWEDEGPGGYSRPSYIN